MHNIKIPPDRWERFAGPAVICFFVVAAAFSPVPWVWRVLLVFATLLVGVLGLWRYWRHRPDAIEITSGGALIFRYQNARRAIVERVYPGVVSEDLLTFRFRLGDGTGSDLLVPSASLSRTDHWVLRRAVLACDMSQKGPHQRRAGR